MYWKSGAVLLLLGVTLAACNETTEPDPRLVEGAGIRFVFPAGADSLTWVRVELWDQGVNATHPIPAPDCVAAASRGVLSPVGAAVDSCTRMRLDIRNWIGDEILSIADTTFPGSLAWGWDELDDDGDPASPGVYRIESACLDSQSSFTFSGYYYVGEAPSDSCQWILWSKDLSGSQLKNAEFGPFPTLGKAETVYEEQLREVGFINPFTVHVYANGMEPYEQQINLTEGKYTDVAVTWTPALPVIPAERSQ